MFWTIITHREYNKRRGELEEEYDKRHKELERYFFIKIISLEKEFELNPFTGQDVQANKTEKLYIKRWRIKPGLLFSWDNGPVNYKTKSYLEEYYKECRVSLLLKEESGEEESEEYNEKWRESEDDHNKDKDKDKDKDED